MNFTIEEIYGCTRDDYMRITGTTPEDMVYRIQQEVDQLKRSLKQKHIILEWKEINTGEPVGIRMANLIGHIEAKIQRKEKKIKDIKKEFVSA